MNRNIILNIDINTVTCPFLNKVMKKGAVSEEDIYPFVDQYIDLLNKKPSQLGAIAFNTFCQFSAVDSKYMTDCAVYTEKKAENGDDVSKKWYYTFYRMNREFGIEPWGVWIKRCKERGYEAWLSIRMNDAHDTDYEECLKDEFAFRAKWKDYAIGDSYGYYWKCLDYSYPEVRERFLGYIGEQLALYDVDALELDFMREIYCFDYLNNPNCAEIMTSFMREVRKLTDAAGEKRGHKIKVSARLAREIDQCLIWGFDVDSWVKEGLVDHITVTPRWSSSDSDMPISEWVSRFPSIEIAAGVETLLRWEDLHRSDDSCPHLDGDSVNGLAANYFSQGAEQINLYNYFTLPADGEILGEMMLRTADILSRCGDMETVLSSARRHIVMYQDIAPEGCTRYKPLPLNAEGEEKTVTVQTGAVPTGKTAYLVLGFAEGSPDSVKIFVNGVPCGGFEPAVSGAVQEYADGSCRWAENTGVPEGSTVWACPVCLDSAPYVQTVAFCGNARIVHVELRID